MIFEIPWAAVSGADRGQMGKRAKKKLTVTFQLRIFLPSCKILSLYLFSIIIHVKNNLLLLIIIRCSIYYFVQMRVLIF